MHPDQRLRKAVKGFYAYIGSVITAGAGPIFGMRLVEHQSPLWRAAGVLVGVGGWIPLLVLTVALIRASDEFAQRIHYLAASLALAGGLLLIAILDWLVRAKFIEPVPYMTLWLSIVALWGISLFVVSRRIGHGSASGASSA
jgi:hypothetical protein